MDPFNRGVAEDSSKAVRLHEPWCCLRGSDIGESAVPGKEDESGRKREDPIECINKAMAFLSAVASRFPPSNNQLRASSNPRNQATIQDEAPVVEQTIPYNSAFQTDNLDAYDSDCDDLSSAKAVLMANLSSWDLEVLSEVPYSDSYPNDMINQDESQDAVIHDTNPSALNDLLVLSLVEQMTDHVAQLDKENQTNKIVNESLTAELERYKERITIFE
ncbi:hypothetical protein Tco_0039722 [Tanacetum coccineum]